MKPFYKITQLLRNITLVGRSFFVRTPDRVRNSVPYVSQFANPAWAEMVLKDGQPLSKDMLWPESGAETIAEYEQWALNACGMACASMAISFFTKKDYPVVKLGRDALRAGVYTQEDDGISTMQYRPFTKWIAKFGITGKVYTKLTLRGLHTLLAQDALVIASVNPNIRGYNTVPNTQVGGHLILVTGYNKTDNTVTFHNPSGFENSQSQSYHTVPLKEWHIYFAGRAIAVSATKK